MTKRRRGEAGSIPQSRAQSLVYRRCQDDGQPVQSLYICIFILLPSLRSLENWHTPPHPRATVSASGRGSLPR